MRWWFRSKDTEAKNKEKAWLRYTEESIMAK